MYQTSRVPSKPLPTILSFPSPGPGTRHPHDDHGTHVVAADDDGDVMHEDDREQPFAPSYQHPLPCFPSSDPIRAHDTWEEREETRQEEEIKQQHSKRCSIVSRSCFPAPSPLFFLPSNTAFQSSSPYHHPTAFSHMPANMFFSSSLSSRVLCNQIPSSLACDPRLLFYLMMSS